MTALPLYLLVQRDPLHPLVTVGPELRARRYRYPGEAESPHLGGGDRLRLVGARDEHVAAHGPGWSHALMFARPMSPVYRRRDKISSLRLAGMSAPDARR
jgi:hypothetical protein